MRTSRHPRRLLVGAVVGSSLVLGSVAVPASSTLMAEAAPTPPAQAPASLDWSPVPVQAPKGGIDTSDLLSTGNMTCRSRSDCVVAGYVESYATVSTGPAEVYHGVIWHWDGKIWSVQGTGVSGSVGLVDTACPSITDCWAVGASFVGKLLEQPVGLIDHYNGTTWSPSTMPDPNGVAFNGISCTSPSNCVAVGNRELSASSAVPLAYRWDGKSWSSLPIPKPTGALWTVLDAVDCFSPTSCIALGDADNSSKGPGYFFGEALSGASWSLFNMPNTQKFDMGNLTGLYGLSCPQGNSCLAVGSALGYTAGQSGADFPGGVADTWDGTSWASVKSPSPPEGGSYILYTDSCLASTDCWVALGFPSILGPLNHNIPLAHWNGSSFTVSTAPTMGFMAAIGCLDINVGTWCIGLGEAAGKKLSSATMAGGDFLVAKGTGVGKLN